MVNLEKLGGVDFQKGCYPGQEIVARAQYRGQVKRRMVRADCRARLRPGEEFNGGTVVDSARGELLASWPRFELLRLLQARPDAAAGSRTPFIEELFQTHREGSSTSTAAGCAGATIRRPTWKSTKA